MEGMRLGMVVCPVCDLVLLDEDNAAICPHAQHRCPCCLKKFDDFREVAANPLAMFEVTIQGSRLKLGRNFQEPPPKRSF